MTKVSLYINGKEIKVPYEEALVIMDIQSKNNWNNYSLKEGYEYKDGKIVRVKSEPLPKEG